MTTPQDDEPAAAFVASPAQKQRRECRATVHAACLYEACEFVNDGHLILLQGRAIMLNRSAHGVSLFTSVALRVGQTIELITPKPWRRRSVNLFEVRWIQLQAVRRQHRLYRVGCSLLFGPLHYWIL
ncbi:MAG: hypothetical protein E8D47_04630 [Nitrospira sp.]|nr:MAG: hypothetical protein E8D47_04630 [Nitrospira sp.]